MHNLFRTIELQFWQPLDYGYDTTTDKYSLSNATAVILIVRNWVSIRLYFVSGRVSLLLAGLCPAEFENITETVNLVQQLSDWLKDSYGLRVVGCNIDRKIHFTVLVRNGKIVYLCIFQQTRWRLQVLTLRAQTKNVVKMSWQLKLVFVCCCVIPVAAKLAQSLTQSDRKRPVYRL